MSELIYVKGAAEIEAVLKTLSAKIEANVVRAALRAGAVVLQKQAKAEAPVGEPSGIARNLGLKSGALQSTVRVSTFKRGANVMASVKAGDRKKGVFYAHMVEGGTIPHTIRGKKLLFFNSMFRKEIKHPGAKAMPFMHDALKLIPQALDAIIARARERLEKLNLKER